MKLNKWTVGLAAVGAISLSSAVQAEEMEMNVVDTAVSGTTISGYISTAFSYNMNTGTDNGAISTFGDPTDRADALGTGKANGFALDVINLTVSKPLGESEWAAGYKAELLFGPDAAGVGTSIAGFAGSVADESGTFGSDFGIKQAYVEVRAPIGNGLEIKMGVFDTIIGYESFNYPDNPNYTRSLGWAIEPTQHTGMLLSYQFNDIVSAAFGIAETATAPINNRPSYTGTSGTKGQWDLTYMGAIAVTAPEDMGFLAGSSLYGGILYGRTGWDFGGASTSGGNQTSYYAGVTLATGVEGLSVGAAFDYLDLQNNASGAGPVTVTGSTWVAGIYSSFQATEKLSLHARGEYGRSNGSFDPGSADDSPGEAWEGTLTAQYDLWANVISRVEVRWDNRNYGPNFGDASSGATLNNAYSIMLNLIYVF